MLTAVADVLAWKGSLNGWDPSTSVTYTSSGNSKWPAGTLVTTSRTSGHRDLNLTTCPGDLMVDRLATIRTTAGSSYRASLAVSSSTVAPPRSVVETWTRPAGTAFTLQGRGFGHGRGMSQYGAYGAASQGATREQILSFYFPNTTRSTTLGNSTLRVRLSAVGSTGTQVVHQDGLTVTDGARTLSLSSTNADGTARSRWRVVPGTTGLTLQWLEGGTWRNRTGWTALATPLSFQNATRNTVRVVMPGGTQRDYRRVVRTVRSGTGAVTVNLLPIDEYLRSVVPSEMSPSWPRAALEAQAVAARTFALYQRAGQPSGSLFDTCDSNACQVYRGMTGYSSTGTSTSYEAATSTAAVTATTGLSVMYGGSPALTEFTSSNGGRTVASSLPYQVAKADPYDGIPAATATAWTGTLAVSAIESAFPTTGTLRALRVDTRDGTGAYGGRITSITVVGASGSSTVSGDTFRSRTGLRSSWWTITSAPAASAGSFPKDLDGNGTSDLLAVDPAGQLRLLAGNGTGGFTAKVIGSSWNSVGLVTAVGAWNGDNRHDVLARAAGTLYYYPGNGAGGFYPRVPIGGGWSGFDLVVGPGDLDGDRLTDLLARNAATSQLVLFRGNGKGGVLGSTVVGTSGWNGLRLIVAPGDVSGDGRPDVLGVSASDGRMRLYRGSGSGGFSSVSVVDRSWSGYSALLGPGDVTGDGRADLVGRRSSDGALVLFTGDGSGSFSQGSVVTGTATWATWTRWLP